MRKTWEIKHQHFVKSLWVRLALEIIHFLLLHSNLIVHSQCGSFGLQSWKLGWLLHGFALRTWSLWLEFSTNFKINGGWFLATFRQRSNYKIILWWEIIRYETENSQNEFDSWEHCVFLLTSDWTSDESDKGRTARNCRCLQLCVLNKTFFLGNKILPLWVFERKFLNLDFHQLKYFSLFCSINESLFDFLWWT